MTLLNYLLYMCLAMTLLPIPADPVVIGMGENHAAWIVALIGGVGSAVAALLEYLLLDSIIGLSKVRRRFANSKIYRRFEKLAGRKLFIAVVVFGMTPLPFDPIRVVAIISRYPKLPYLAAVFLGRTPRYYLLALLGSLLHFPFWSLVGITLLMILYTLVSGRRTTQEEEEKQESVKENLLLKRCA